MEALDDATYLFLLSLFCGQVNFTLTSLQELINVSDHQGAHLGTLHVADVWLTSQEQTDSSEFQMNSFACTWFVAHFLAGTRDKFSTGLQGLRQRFPMLAEGTIICLAPPVVKKIRLDVWSRK